MATNGSKTSFEDTAAVRESVPVWLGLYGFSGSGKTRSALRIATGMQRVTGGEIFVVDTESKRAKLYAPEEEGKVTPGKYLFRHVDFREPFSPARYLAAVQHCIERGAKIIIIDSMSHEHEGPGGVLEMHAAETKRLADLWKTKESAAQIAAWVPVKAERRRALNTMMQLGAHMIFCFRAGDKIKPPPKGERDVVQLGTMPTAGKEWVYEMTACGLLRPGSEGRPTWKSTEPGENMMIKAPDFLAPVFERVGQLDEEAGQMLAEWAAGGAKPKTEATPERPAVRILTALAAAISSREIDAIAIEAKAIGAQINKREADEIRKLAAARREALAGVVSPEQEPPRGMP